MTVRLYHYRFSGGASPLPNPPLRPVPSRSVRPSLGESGASPPVPPDPPPRVAKLVQKSVKHGWGTVCEQQVKVIQHKPRWIHSLFSDLFREVGSVDLGRVWDCLGEDFEIFLIEKRITIGNSKESCRGKDQTHIRVRIQEFAYRPVNPQVMYQNLCTIYKNIRNSYEQLILNQ